MSTITLEQIQEFKFYLVNEEKSTVTIDKYIHDIMAFSEWLGNNTLDKTTVLEYKEVLIQKFATASVNAAIASLNSFFGFAEHPELKVKSIRVQRQMFCRSDKELTKAEYERLLCAAYSKRNERLMLVMQTICSTGIRVSELRFITVEAIRMGYAGVNLKGKMRLIILPKELCLLLLKYARSHSISTGSVFITRNGRPLDRHTIWKEMKNLCKRAGVSRDKVFPHNLRHLFARTYYSAQKDIVRLADVLGHSSINTTRIYTIEDGHVHRQQVQKLGLVKLQI